MKEQDQSAKKPKKSETKRNSAAGLGSQMAVAFALFVWGGMELDDRYGIDPYGQLGGVALALIYSFYEVWKLTRK